MSFLGLINQQAGLRKLQQPIDQLELTTSQMADKIEKLVAGRRLIDLLFYLPSHYIDRRIQSDQNLLPLVGKIITLRVHIVSHRQPKNRNAPYRIYTNIADQPVFLTYFRGNPAYLQKILPPNSERIVSGRLEMYRQQLQITHPDYVLTQDQAEKLPDFAPVYRSGEGISPRVLEKIITRAVDYFVKLPLGALTEWIDPDFCRQKQWPDWRSAMITIHRPRNLAAGELSGLTRNRLAYDELLANQLALAIFRARLRNRPGRVLQTTQKLVPKILNSLSFKLTPDQEKAVQEITADLAHPYPMRRLLQGDVGSGKTIIAFLAMLIAVENGAQAALMAPTEILAEQHEKILTSLARFCAGKIALLCARHSGKERRAILTQIKNGETAIIIGTHSLFQQTVEFHDLGLIIIDEQHRFGVAQRLALTHKGKKTKTERPNLLIMTATPIPRSLALSQYGDMQTSILRQKPPGRKEITTRLLPLSKTDEAIAWLGKIIEKNIRAYWICPVIAESEKSDLAAAQTRFHALSQKFSSQVSLLHGQMKTEEKQTAMARFVTGESSILVATTAVEVGVDVPEANVMVIEHADRFGLAQLHQLRGRIGRGAQQAVCLLLYQQPLGQMARERLSLLKQTNDGFRIAEEDLRLRGGGQILGTRQSGLAQFRLADMDTHKGLLIPAHDDARASLTRDPDLTQNRGRALRILLQLFQKNRTLSYIHAG